ncbi:RES family NAD+ phosphorylase [Agrobacterium fabrum]|uniref:RES family NAD+ phosphorylase n=1 Tax=Agrobacterium fabrum TaxID=1176649 RepID=UPI002157ED9D|nr:RES family NAD+ phosphorylase [Agrobacterium fabrum]MCR6727919.1 RES family NAD+ phosphorylase [Agrobacterium fabrum]
MNNLFGQGHAGGREELRFCPRCFENKGLQRRLIDIRPQFPDEKCSFHPTMKGLPAKDVAAIVDQVFRNNYEYGDYNSFSNEQSGDDLQAILYELTGADLDEVIVALEQQLIDDDDYWPPDGGDPFYQSDAGYVRSFNAFGSHSQLWDEFCQSILHGQRFFNDRARRLLEEIFDGIHLQRGPRRHDPIFEVLPGSPESRVFRVRTVDNLEERKKISQDIPLHLGPPPARLRRPGRMNPSGIMAFYAAFDIETCIAEMRPSVGSIVIGAEFEITEPVWVLDTTRFAGPFKEPNLFSKDHVKRTAQWRFMQRFMHEIAQPISPGDEHLDYIPTQAVAEYLLNHHKFHLGGQKHRIEAIVYRSAQHPGGRNIVFLGDACTIEAVPTPSPNKPSTLGEPFDTLLATLPRHGPFGMPPRMRVRDNSLQVRRIQGASFDTEPYSDRNYHDDDDDDDDDDDR